jgi:hypothetical protein
VEDHGYAHHFTNHTIALVDERIGARLYILRKVEKICGGLFVLGFLAA